MIMSFCRESVPYSFLGLTTSIDTTTFATNNEKLPFGCQPYHHQYHISSSLPGGFGLISAIDGDIQSLPNVIESPSVKSTLPSSPDYMFTTPPARKDPGGMGFIDDMGGGVDGLMSCTESLGFESSDERRFDHKIEEAMSIDQNDGNRDRFQRSTTKKMRWKKEGGGEVKKFPPPLSSLSPNGRRNFFLRAVRKDGRLELTEVRIDRTEILRASREDGRLRLHLIRDNVEEEEEDDVIDEEIEQEQDKEEEEKEKEKAVFIDKEEEQLEENEIGRDLDEVVLQKVIGVDVEEERPEKEMSSVEEWEFPVSGEGFRRCHELVSHHDHHHHHHHNLHVWRQHCVTTGS